MANPQQQVARAVADRGYRDGWTAEQYAVRQMLKLGEELGELVDCIRILRSPGWAYKEHFIAEIKRIGEMCRDLFDDIDRETAFTIDTAQARKEAPDVQVPLFTLAEALAELDGEPFAVVDAAVKKATADVARGKRKEGPA